MSLSTAAELTQQFYDWEQRGRGWHKAPVVIELEPPFEPFLGHFLEEGQIIDDGKRPSFFAQLFNTESQRQEPERKPSLKPYPFEDDAPLTIYSIRLPFNARLSTTRMEQLLVLLSHIISPISFELIATSDVITIQLTCREQYSRYLHDQCKAFFPECSILESEQDIIEDILNTDGGYSVVDFGLFDEFMLPIATGGGDHDSYTALFGILNHLKDNEAIILQVLFNGTVNPWGQHILTAVYDDFGKQSFFMDAPEMPNLAKHKIQSPLCAVTVRMLACADDAEDASHLLLQAATAFIQTTKSPHNSLQPLEDEAYTAVERITDIALRRSHRVGMLLNTAELATLAHFPNIASKKLHQQTRATKSYHNNTDHEDYILGWNSHQGVTQPCYLSLEERLRHTHILGATGTGKSTLLHCLICQDIYSDIGCCILDPHGDLIDNILAYIPESRIDDVVIIDPTDQEYTIPLNILSAHSELEKELLASDLVGLFKRFSTSFGDQMHNVLANALLALLYNTRPWHLGDLKRFLVEPAYRQNVLSSVTDPDITYYWQHEFALLKGGSIGPLITRLDSFLRPKAIRNMLCQKESLDLSECMNSQKIILVKLPQGLIGEENSYLLGALIIARLQQCAMARQAQAATEREPFFIYIDEFHHFITPSMASILSGARKYGVGLILAHQDMQSVAQIDSGIANSIMSNAYTRICFRLSDTDGKRMQENFVSFSAADFQQLDVGEAIVRAGAIDNDFSLDVYPFVLKDIPHYEELIVHNSRIEYGVQINPIAATVEQPEPIPPKFEAAEPKPAPKPQTKVSPSSTSNEEIREHRYLQEFIKRMAQEFGYIAILECPTPDGKGLVDIVLEKEKQKIAIEISVSTTSAWEIHNAQKCLDAGFHNIIICTSDADKLKVINSAIQSSFKPDEASKIRCIQPQEIAAILQPAPTAPTATTIKGYRVKVQYDDSGADKKALIQRIVHANRTRKP